MTACNRTHLAAPPALRPWSRCCPPPAPIAPPPSANPFVGAWTTAERQQIAFRDDTVVMNPPGEPPTPLGAEICDGGSASPTAARAATRCWR